MTRRSATFFAAAVLVVSLAVEGTAHQEPIDKIHAKAEQGDAEAQYNLGRIYANGEGVPPNAVEAVRWFRLGAAQGHADAQNGLGVMYASGRGVPQDDAEAVRWYRLAADQADGNAQFRLGGMYKDGKGVKQNYVEAARWYRLAAEQGHGNAMFTLGAIYKDGEGVLPDEDEAVRWYRLAAEQGFDLALSNLGFLYFERADYVQAYLWFNRYSARLPLGWPAESRTGFRDMAYERLTPEQRTEVQRLVREWNEAPPRD
jgi:hypothetical protein